MRSLLLIAPLALAACATTGMAPPAPGDGVCRGDNLGQFAGRPATPQLDAEMMRVSGARIIRRVAKGMMVTMEYSDQRLTVWLTEDNRVERATCG